jgi:hypothetical protein
MGHWTDALVNMNACPETVEWARGYRSLSAAWKACDRGDWMLWLIGETTASEPWSEERKPLVRVGLECAQFVPWIEDDATLARIWCLDALERWFTGEAGQDEVIAAAYAAGAAADAAGAAGAAAYAAYAAYAAGAAADAAYAADAAGAAAYAAYAAGAAAYAAYAAYAAGAAADAAYAAADAVIADIVRKHFSKPPSLAARAAGR